MDTNLKLEREVERLWNHLAECGLQSTYLYPIIIHVPQLRQRAWETFLTLQPTDEEFGFIIADCDELCAEAWDHISSHQLSNGLLFTLVLNASSVRVNGAATRRLLQQHPDNSELCMIIEYCRTPSLQMQAARQLLHQNPDFSDLLCIMNHAPEAPEDYNGLFEEMERREQAFGELMRVAGAYDEEDEDWREDEDEE